MIPGIPVEIPSRAKPVSEQLGEIFSLDELAKYLKVGKRTIYRLVAEKKIPAFKVGRAWRFTRADIDHGIKQQSTASRR